MNNYPIDLCSRFQDMDETSHPLTTPLKNDNQMGPYQILIKLQIQHPTARSLEMLGVYKDLPHQIPNEYVLYQSLLCMTLGSHH